MARGSLFLFFAFVAVAAGQPPIPLPPGTIRVVAYDRWGAQLAICAEVPPKEATLMRRNGRRLPPTTIFVIDGEVIRKILTGLGGCDPAWSRDGKRLAYTAPDGLWIITIADDSGVRLVDTTLAGDDYTIIGQPKWSPDSAHIAFILSGQRKPRAQVVTTNDGTVVFTSAGRASEIEWTDARTLTVDGRPWTVR